MNQVYTVSQRRKFSQNRKNLLYQFGIIFCQEKYPLAFTTIVKANYLCCRIRKLSNCPPSKYGIRRELNEFKNQLYDDLVQLIEESRAFVANTANKTITLMNWKIGHRINIDFFDNQRAGYGKQIMSQLATQLQQHFGKRGFQERNIRRMMQFAELFPDFQFVSQAMTKLS